MIVQERASTLRLIPQHEHGLASGRMAQEWVGFSARPERLSHKAVLAISLHDFSWKDADAKPEWNTESCTVHSFQTHPIEERVAFYSCGLDQVEKIHPYCGLLGSLHYAGFPGSPPRFAEAETARQERLCQELGIGGEADDRLSADRAFLRLFDSLSLFVCLTGPEALGPPSWLGPDEVGVAPSGERFALTWRDEAQLALEPFPFREPIVLSLPCVDLPRSLPGKEALRLAWRDTQRRHHRVHLIPG